MKYLTLIVFVLFLASCDFNKKSASNIKVKKSKTERKIETLYKPGLGIIMNSVQIHHSKLWFAGQNKNWELAEFEIHELKERLEDLRIYHSKSKEATLVKTIEPSIASLEETIELEDFENFNKYFQNLTVSCNSCHKATNHSFIKIKIPNKPAYSNQVY